jgi:hypothetical protein
MASRELHDGHPIDEWERLAAEEYARSNGVSRLLS